MIHSLTDPIFTTAFSNSIFTSEATVNAMKRFEMALISALGQHNFLTKNDADQLIKLIASADIPATEIVKRVAIAGNASIPFVKLLTASVEIENKNLSRWVHFGATSQDLIDSVLMGQLKLIYLQLTPKTLTLAGLLAKLADEHRNTAMMGRTLLQQAKPITFGYKVSTWLNELLEVKKDIDYLCLEGFPIQFGGAVGTLSAYGNQGDAIMCALAAELQLTEADMPWHTQRTPLLRIAQNLNHLCTILGKMAKDIILLMQTEVAEVSEGKASGKGGSSAMPHKQNPVSSLFLVAIAKKSIGLVSSFQQTCIQEHERAAGNWQSEWNLMPELAALALSAVEHATDLIENLNVNKVKMQANIEQTMGLIFSEELAAALSETMGKTEATRLVKLACEDTLNHDIPLRESILKYITSESLERDAIFNIYKTTGLSEYYVTKTLKKYNNYVKQKS
ncbi:lyase family protein [Pedobacter sp. AW1-32]|uniref:lyase family protein n=1 Tax=Pedobacter sp. AW1-32 TaxID=3383026 RepID=UPI003FEF7BFA